MQVAQGRGHAAADLSRKLHARFLGVRRAKASRYVSVEARINDAPDHRRWRYLPGRGEGERCRGRQDWPPHRGIDEPASHGRYAWIENLRVWQVTGAAENGGADHLSDTA